MFAQWACHDTFLMPLYSFYPPQVHLKAIGKYFCPYLPIYEYQQVLINATLDKFSSEILMKLSVTTDQRGRKLCTAASVNTKASTPFSPEPIKKRSERKEKETAERKVTVRKKRKKSIVLVSPTLSFFDLC